jgi:anti-anti-sigma factor
MAAIIDLTATVGGGPDGAVVLYLAGEMDGTTVPTVTNLVDAALGERPPTIVLDLSGVTFVDSRGIRALLIAHRAAERRGTTLVVRSPDKQARKVLMLTGCEQVLNLQAD